MESYTTISVKPEVKKVLKHLKGGSETYGEYIKRQIGSEEYSAAVEVIEEGEETED